MTPKFACLISAWLLLMAGSAPAQEASARPPKIFTGDAVLAVTIAGPWRTISRRKESGKSWPGTFSYTDRGGAEVRIPVEITTRGLTRLRVCDFPPLRLDFDDDAAQGTAFRDAGNLKMVTHCLRASRFQQYYVKEYLAYKIYSLVTDMSYRVQGLDVSYVDSERDDTEGRFAFLIEDPDDVAERNGLDKLDINYIKPGRLDPLETTRFSVFQYLIGNLDWSFLSGPGDHCCHNARLIGTDPDATPVYAIPYDLDSCGLVDAHYAAPPAGLRVRDITQRLYRGLCAHNGLVAGVVEEFRELRPEFQKLFENEPRLDSRNRRKALRYIEDFYEDLEDQRGIEKKLIDNCRG